MADIPPFPFPQAPGGGRFISIGGGSVARAVSQLELLPAKDTHSKFFDLATGRWRPWIKSNISYERLPTELWIYIMTFLPYHSLRKLAMVNTFFLDLLESPALDKTLFRKPSSNGADSAILSPQNVELHPMLMELGSYIGWKLAENFLEVSVLPARHAHSKTRRKEKSDPGALSLRAPTTHFHASYTHQQRHPTYPFAPKWRNNLDDRRFFIVQAAFDAATHPPVQQLYLQFMSGMPLCIVKGSDKDGDRLAVGDVVHALANYSASEDLKMFHTLIGKANGDKYVGLVVNDELGPNGHIILKAGFDLEEDGSLRLMPVTIDGALFPESSSDGQFEFKNR